MTIDLTIVKCGCMMLKILKREIFFALTTGIAFIIDRAECKSPIDSAIVEPNHEEKLSE